MLKWSIEKVADWEKKRETDNGFLDALIWASLTIGMDKLTSENIKEWVYRIERCRFENHGLFATEKDGKGAYMEITEADLEPWIGLKTNVSTYTNAEFDRRMREWSGR